MPDFEGWLLDLFEDPQSGIILWFIGKDGQRRRLRQEFPVTWYAGGTERDLRALCAFLRAQNAPVKITPTKRRDLYKRDIVSVLAVEMQPAGIFALVCNAARHFPSLDFYDADIPVAIRYAALYNVFPLAFCRVAYEDEYIRKVEVLDSPWDLDPPPIPLRILQMDLDCDPRYKNPGELLVRFEEKEYHIPIRYERSSLIRLNSILTNYDPDFILTNNGDTWLLPYLLEMAERSGIPLMLNREQERSVLVKKEGSYFSYGRIVYRGQQVLLYGRCHIDSRNAMLWQDYELASALEMARVTRLPIQTAARCSPGTGINMMEICTALRQAVLVPWQKTHGEEIKTAYELLQNDQGGLVYQPIGGVHENVGMIDFISLYPSIMTYCNISPELPPPTHLGDSPYPPGLIPLTLKPLLEKRVQLKQTMLSLSPDDPTRPYYKARASSLKMLLVCCFGYLGYKAAKFGRIESHEAISALGREALLVAKEAAEEMGFTVLHLYVDGIWVQKKGCEKPDDFLPLLNEIVDRTSLPIALDCIYRWVAFLPARQDNRLTVPNRYFGVKQDGSTTVRGIEIRTHDTAPYVARTQESLLDVLKSASTLPELQQRLPKALQLITKRYKRLRQGEVGIADLVVHKRMGKELEAYRVQSPAALAARQLQEIGEPIRLGQRVPLVYTLGKPGVSAWNSRIPIDPRSVNYPYYCKLLTRAASAILQPFHIDEQKLQAYLLQDGIVQTPLCWR
ncbi:MAG: DNA polymerase domain-containing protein [Anaerolineaceae bacterium]